MNNVVLAGTAVSAPEFSHKIYGEKFYRFLLDIARKSGTHDIIPCVVSEVYADFESGSEIKVIGEVRTQNFYSGGKRHLDIFVHVQEMLDYDGYDENIVEIEGYICKEPTYRETPYGRTISDFICASNRGHGKSDYIPCITWGRNALRVSKIDVGTKISVAGRFQSREYEKNIGDEIVVKTAYELSISTLDITDDE